MKYKNQKQLAKQILECLGIKKEPEGYLVMINGKYEYHQMTDSNQQLFIDEIIDQSNVNWFDDEQLEGTIEVNGKQVWFAYERAV